MSHWVSLYCAALHAKILFWRQLCRDKQRHSLQHRSDATCTVLCRGVQRSSNAVRPLMLSGLVFCFQLTTVLFVRAVAAVRIAIAAFPAFDARTIVAAAELVRCTFCVRRCNFMTIIYDLMVIKFHLHYWSMVETYHSQTRPLCRGSRRCGRTGWYLWYICRSCRQNRRAHMFL